MLGTERWTADVEQELGKKTGGQSNLSDDRNIRSCKS